MAEDLRLKKISDLPIADAVGDNDVLVGVQQGVTKRFPKILLANKNRAVSLREFGATLDGTTNDYIALLAAISSGSIPVFDGPCLIAPPTAEAAASLLATINRWQLLGKVTLNLPASNAISLNSLLDLNNPTLGNLNINGQFVSVGTVTAIASTGGSAKNWSFTATLPAGSGAQVGDYLLLKPGTGWTEWDAFVAGPWEITAVAGNVVSFTTCNAYPTLPVSAVETGGLSAWVVKTVVRFPRDSIGIRLNGCVLGSIRGVSFCGQFNPVVESPFDGKGDGLQVGGAADTYSTGLNESEQIHHGATWVQVVSFSRFQGNGTQVLHGGLYGSLLFLGGNAWRGEQSAGSGHSLVKSSVSAGNGASNYETEALGNKDFADSWAIGGQQEGVFAIGASQCGGLNVVSMFNVGAQVDARNGANIILDGATITGTAAIRCNGAKVTVGAGAVVTGALSVDEGGFITAKGASSVTGPLTIEAGSNYQLPDGSMYLPTVRRQLAGTNFSYQINISSIGDVSYQWAPTGSSTYTTSFTMKQAGDFYPASTTQNLGRNANQWGSLYAKNVVLQPPASVTPANNGDVMLQLTSNTSLTFKVKGSDGVVRSASLTLA